MIHLLAAVAVIGLLGFGAARSYNRFVSQRQLIDNSWSNVDTELQRRHDLVPNLVEVARGYAAHERATILAVIEARDAAARAAGTGTGQSGPENQLVHGIRRLLALIESYPDLRATEHFLRLQTELSRTENRIQAARRIYNGNVREYNQRVESVPSLVVARAARLDVMPYFELDPLVREMGAHVTQVAGRRGQPGDMGHTAP